METAEKLIKDRIKAQGPIDIGIFMELALGDPKAGYYMTRDPLGARGDFITSPEISQLFGEMIAVSMAEAWIRGGSLDAHLVELGPGRGTLTRDIWRATKNAPLFHQRIDIHLVETSPVLRDAQKKTLEGLVKPIWHDHIDALPKDAPLLIVANEFFDALPIRQAVATERGWHERVILLDGDNLMLGTKPGVFPMPLKAPGTVIEYSPVRDDIMQKIAVRLQNQGGLMIAIDYGHNIPGAAGDTFQAVHRHGYCSPLDHIGNADLTSHVDFARLAQIAKDQGCNIYGPVTQKAFLETMGIHRRLEALIKQAPALASGVERITADPGMGGLFRVLGVSGNVKSSPFQPAGF